MVSENLHSLAAQQINISKNLILPKYTTTERNNLNAIEGEIIYNTSTNKINFYNGSSWEVITSS